MSFKKGDIIVFNQAASYYRDSWVFARVTNVRTSGRLDIEVFGKKDTVVHSTPVLQSDIVTPDLDRIVSEAFLTPKRGKDAAPDYFRWKLTDQSCNVVVSLYDENKVYKEENCF